MNPIPQSLPSPRLDTEGMIGLYKANVETFVAAQRVMFEFSQTLARRQVEMMKTAMHKADTMSRGSFDNTKQPQAYVEDAKAALEQAMAEVKDTMNLGLKAQQEVVDLFVRRAGSNLDEVRSLAA